MDINKRLDELEYASELALKRMVVELEEKNEKLSKYPAQIREIKEFLESEIKRHEGHYCYDDHSVTIDLILDKVKEITT